MEKKADQGVSGFIWPCLVGFCLWRSRAVLSKSHTSFEPGVLLYLQR